MCYQRERLSVINLPSLASVAFLLDFVLVVVVIPVARIRALSRLTTTCPSPSSLAYGPKKSVKLHLLKASENHCLPTESLELEIPRVDNLHTSI